MKTTLLIMAAGIGSRFGTGIKQLEPVDASNHIIMDYSIHDAIEAGFNHVVFIIRKDIEKEFKEVIGDRIASICSSHGVTVDYAFQDINDIPGTLPEGRTKPWGTGQAVLAAKKVIKTPFIVINADDYYGKEGFKAVHEYLVNGGKSCMAGFVLKNTLSDNGGVTRGICKMDDQNNLTEVVETKNIVKTAEGAEADGVAVDVNSLVSMNMWGLTHDFLDVLEEGFKEFFEKEVPGNPQKAEYLIPIFIGELLEQGKMSVKVLKTNDTWYGMTYHEDVAAVKDSFKKMLENGVYKNHLVLDEEVSDVVVRIFLWKKSGMKEREIAKKLSAQGIPTPFTRRCQLGYLKNTLRVKDPTWQTVFVTKVLENPIYTGTMVYNRIAYDETNRKIGQNPRESWRMVPDSHPAIISWELFDEISALREAEQAVKEERKKWCRQRRKNNPNIFKGRIFCKKCGEKLVCHWQSDGTLYFYCASCHVSISEKDLWDGINKELHQRMEEHRDLQKLVRKSSGKSKLQSKEIATKREIEQASGNIVRLESQKRSGYEQYVLGKLSKEKFLELKQGVENEIVLLKQTKSEREKELAVVQEELQQKKQIAGNTEVLLTVDNLLQYVKKIEVDRRKITYTEFVF